SRSSALLIQYEAPWYALHITRTPKPKKPELSAHNLQQQLSVLLKARKRHLVEKGPFYLKNNSCRATHKNSLEHPSLTQTVGETYFRNVSSDSKTLKNSPRRPISSSIPAAPLKHDRPVTKFPRDLARYTRCYKSEKQLFQRSAWILSTHKCFTHKESPDIVTFHKLDISTAKDTAFRNHTAILGDFSQ